MNHLKNQEKQINDFLGDLNTWESVKDDSILAMSHPENRRTQDELRKT